MNTERLEELLRECDTTEIVPGHSYIIAYDINKIPRNSIQRLSEWMSDTCEARAIMVACDGDKALSIYKVKKEDADANRA